MVGRCIGLREVGSVAGGAEGSVATITVRLFRITSEIEYSDVVFFR